MQKELSCRYRVLKYRITLLFAITMWLPGFSQEADSVKIKNWDVSAVLLTVFTPDNTFLVPIAYVNYKRLHLEPRYQYENFETFSMFAGYNIAGGRKLRYLLTPMIGGIVGRTDGIAPGLEADLGLGRFGFYTEMEYLFDLNDTNNSYYYAWSHLRFGITKWMSAGIAGGRNRIYKTSVHVQRGLSLGLSKGKVSITGYYYNPFTSDNYGALSLFMRF